MLSAGRRTRLDAKGTVRHINTPDSQAPEPPREERNEFIRGPRWRVEATPERRRTAAIVTFAIVFAIGLAIMVFAMIVLNFVGSPGWVVTAPWLIPTVGVVVWTLVRPRPAIAANDDEAWVTYAVLFVLAGADQPRPTPARVITAVILGGPTVWALAVVWVLAIVGILDA